MAAHPLASRGGRGGRRSGSWQRSPAFGAGPQLSKLMLTWPGARYGVSPVRAARRRTDCRIPNVSRSCRSRNACRCHNRCRSRIRRSACGRRRTCRTIRRTDSASNNRWRRNLRPRGNCWVSCSNSRPRRLTARGIGKPSPPRKPSQRSKCRSYMRSRGAGRAGRSGHSHPARCSRSPSLSCIRRSDTSSRRPTPGSGCPVR